MYFADPVNRGLYEEPTVGVGSSVSEERCHNVSRSEFLETAELHQSRKALLSRRSLLRSGVVLAGGVGLGAFLGSNQAWAASPGVTAAVAPQLARPVGSGIYAFENLGIKGMDLKAAMAAAMGAGKRQGIRTPTLTLPAGVFQTVGFGQSANNCGFLVPDGLSLVGSGPGTVLRVADNSATSSQMGTNLKLMIVPNGRGVRIAQFTLDGTPQRGKIYHGLHLSGCSGAVLADIKVTGVPGNYNSPPGETFAVNVFNSSGSRLYRVEVDGRDGSGKKVVACGIGINNTSNIELHECYTHHTGFSHGVSIWQSSGIQSWNHRSEYNGTALDQGGSYGSLGAGINHEKSSNCVHNSLTLGYNSHSELRYYAVPYRSSDPHSGNTTGHAVQTLRLTDGGEFKVRLDNSQTTLPRMSSTPPPKYY